MMAHAEALFKRGYKQNGIIKLFAETLEKLKRQKAENELPSQDNTAETNRSQDRTVNTNPEATQPLTN